MFLFVCLFRRSNCYTLQSISHHICHIFTRIPTPLYTTSQSYTTTNYTEAITAHPFPHSRSAVVAVCGSPLLSFVRCWRLSAVPPSSSPSRPFLSNPSHPIPSRPRRINSHVTHDAPVAQQKSDSTTPHSRLVVVSAVIVHLSSPHSARLSRPFVLLLCRRCAECSSSLRCHEASVSVRSQVGCSV